MTTGATSNLYGVQGKGENAMQKRGVNSQGQNGVSGSYLSYGHRIRAKQREPTAPVAAGSGGGWPSENGRRVLADTQETTQAAERETAAPVSDAKSSYVSRRDSALPSVRKRPGKEGSGHRWPRAP